MKLATYKPTRSFTPYQWLPHYIKLAIERLDRDNELRTGAQLDELIDRYAEQYRETCDKHERYSAHLIASKRFYDYND